MTAEKCEAELRQDRCMHILESITATDKTMLPGYKYRCLKCGKYLKKLNGVLRESKPISSAERQP